MAEEDLSMYTEASASYDSTNRWLSFSGDSKVRLAAAEFVIDTKPLRVLDMATGTGETAIKVAELANAQKLKTLVIGLDANKAMLNVAIEKARSKGIKGIRFEIGNVTKVRYPDNYFDAVTCSFSTKNFGNLEGFVKEAYRVLRKGGKLVIADISIPEGASQRAVFNAYLFYMRLIAAIAQKKLYNWLPGSTSTFSKSAFLQLLKKDKFKSIETKDFFFGIAYVITCSK